MLPPHLADLRQRPAVIRYQQPGRAPEISLGTFTGSTQAGALEWLPVDGRDQAPRWIHPAELLAVAPLDCELPAGAEP